MKKSTLLLFISTALFFTSTLVLLYLNYLKPTSTSTPTTGVIPTETINPTTNPTVDWKTYTISTEPTLNLVNYQIRLPSTWIQIEHSSNFQNIETFQNKSTNFTYKLTIDQEENINPDTGKAYASLQEFTGLSYEVPNLIVAGQSAAQVLPRAGSETYYKVLFFSKDNKTTFAIELDTPLDASKLKEGKALFDQILSTFKFNNQNNNLGNWIKRANGDFQTSSGCLWLMTTKANDSGSLDQYVKNYFKTDSLDPFINSQKYQVKNHETITISPQGVGELFTVFFPEDTKKYSISFNVTNQDNILETVQCQNYQKDINFVLNNPENFVNN